MEILLRAIKTVFLSLLGVAGLWAGILVYSAVSSHGTAWAWAASVAVFLFVVMAIGLAIDHASSAIRRRRPG